jgi:hypothetical protein
MALCRYQDAVDALNKALQLEPENKALLAEIQKAQSRLQESFADVEPSKPTSLETGASTSSVVQNETQYHSQSTIAKDKQSAREGGKHMSQSVNEDADSDLFSSSDHVRGYKLVNGKKTSFFHHEQTTLEKQLIGDIAPKRIQVAVQDDNVADSHKHNNTSASSGTSAWNKAGTWEEKDLTQIALSSLSETLLKCTYTIPQGSSAAGSMVRVTNVSKLISVKDGGNMHASMASVRGKKRLIFEFSACIHWELQLVDTQDPSFGTRTCRGSMTFPDVDGTHEIGQGYDISDYIVDADTPSHSRFLLERFVRDGGLRHELEQAMDAWILSLKHNN